MAYSSEETLSFRMNLLRGHQKSVQSNLNIFLDIFVIKDDSDQSHSFLQPRNNIIVLFFLNRATLRIKREVQMNWIVLANWDLADISVNEASSFSFWRFGIDERCLKLHSASVSLGSWKLGKCTCLLFYKPIWSSRY